MDILVKFEALSLMATLLSKADVSFHKLEIASPSLKNSLKQVIVSCLLYFIM